MPLLHAINTDIYVADTAAATVELSSAIISLLQFNY
jgi:hypothetical protein